MLNLASDAVRRRRETMMASRSAILAPGGNNSVDVPVLMFTRLAVQRRGGSTHPLVWEFAEGRDFASQRPREIGRAHV